MLANAGRQDAASQFGAAAGNQASMFNAGQFNDFMNRGLDRDQNLNMFNAGQGDNAANRALQASGMLGQLANQYGDGTRADLGMMSGLGDQQRAIEAAYRGAPLSQLQSIGALSGLTPYQILVGQRTNGTTSGTSSGTATTAQSNNPLSSMLGLASIFF